MSTAVTARQREALRLLGRGTPDDVYLAGGVAIALIFEHRASHDLDLFTPRAFEPARVAEQLQSSLSRSVLSITGTADGTLYLEIEGVPASLLTYRYPLLAPAERSRELGVRVASPDDLACMKLSAIASRGQARDFWDLELLLEHGAAGGSLSEALQCYRLKFASDDVGHVVRSLAYFGDADTAPLPRGLDPARWASIKSWFSEQVRKIE